MIPLPVLVGRVCRAMQLAVDYGHPVAFQSVPASPEPDAMYYIEEACWEVFPARPAERPRPPLYVVPAP